MSDEKNDLISRKAAIDALGEEPMVWTEDDDYALGERSQWQIDKLAIETVPSAQPEQRWIPDACRYCSNHPSNGGSGICHCTLGSIQWT